MEQFGAIAIIVKTPVVADNKTPVVDRCDHSSQNAVVDEISWCYDTQVVS
jgi:hypothetical protein